MNRLIEFFEGDELLTIAKEFIDVYDPKDREGSFDGFLQGKGLL